MQPRPCNASSTSAERSRPFPVLAVGRAPPPQRPRPGVLCRTRRLRVVRAMRLAPPPTRGSSGTRRSTVRSTGGRRLLARLMRFPRAEVGSFDVRRSLTGEPRVALLGPPGADVVVAGGVRPVAGEIRQALDGRGFLPFTQVTSLINIVPCGSDVQRRAPGRARCWVESPAVDPVRCKRPFPVADRPDGERHGPVPPVQMPDSSAPPGASRRRGTGTVSAFGRQRSSSVAAQREAVATGRPSARPVASCVSWRSPAGRRGPRRGCPGAVRCRSASGRRG